MKIQLVSDLHLEFNHTPAVENAGADVLVLAGDICMAAFLKTEDEFMPLPREARFLRECAQKFAHVVYVMGNHEHYKHLFNDTASVIRETVAGLPNFHFLDNESVMIDGVKFIGATLWTDMNDNCPLTMDHLWRSMSDFHVIKYRDMLDSYFKFTPKTAYREHLISRMFIEGELDGETPTVIVTHHAPSYQSIHEMYKTEHYMNGGYASDLEYMMAPNVKLWCHGHMHNNFDYEVFGTRVVCNPHGYPGERENPNTNFIVEV
jgi:Icc-related predicted phosphoesterase